MRRFFLSRRLRKIVNAAPPEVREVSPSIAGGPFAQEPPPIDGYPEEIERLRQLCHKHIDEKSQVRLELLNTQLDLDVERKRTAVLSKINQFATHAAGCLYEASPIEGEITPCSCGLFEAIDELEKIG